MTHTDKTTLYDSAVVDAVRQGLLQSPKTLPSWLYYDEVGDALFQQIMYAPEYYLTRCELEILRKKKQDLFQLMAGHESTLKIVELGAGDGIKTEILLHHFTEHNLPFTYMPVDVSQSVLDQLVERLDEDMPHLEIEPQCGLYHDVLQRIAADGDGRKFILFLGSNIGNFTLEEAQHFLQKLASTMRPDDYLLIGFDLKKDPVRIRAAYSDMKRLTHAFNINLLERLNRELGAQFITQQFDYYSSYDPHTGTVKNYLISKQDQDVFIRALDLSVHFDKWEGIHAETSQKYNIAMIETLIRSAGLRIADVFYDTDKYFCDVIIRL